MQGAKTMADQDNNLYVMQPSFTAGEISNEVSSRSDIQKYQSALLQAKNCYIRPYGAVYRRSGTKFCCETKYADKKSILIKFTYSVDTNYYLEFGHNYMRVHRDGQYLGIELLTPFAEEDLENLSFLQSADTMFICSGKYPIQELSRYTEEEWRFKEFEISTPYFELMTNIELPSDIPEARSYSAPGTYSWTCTKSGYYEITLAGGGGGCGGWANRGITSSFGGETTVASAIGYDGNTPTLPPDAFLSAGGRGDRVVRNIYLTEGHTYSISVGGGGAPGGLQNVDITQPFSHLYGQVGGGGAGGTSYFIDNTTGTTLFGAGGGAGGNGQKWHYNVNIQGEHINGLCFNGGQAVQGASAGNGQGGVGGSATYNNSYAYYNGWFLYYIPTNVAGGAGGAGYASIIYSTISNGIENSISPTAINGDITLNASSDLFTKGQENNYIKLYQSIASSTVSISGSGVSGSLRVGSSWKIITHGTWVGTVTLQKSLNNSIWEDYRKYTGNNDSNITESGTVEETCYLRVMISNTSGATTVDLTALPYEHEGVAKLIEYVNPRQMKAKVTVELGNTSAVTAYAFGAWCQDYGYPKTACFFQDRLCLANNKRSPYTLWASRSGDYGNFGVDKAAGTVTDDSGIAVPCVSRHKYKIEHLVPGSDLIILTEGNEWRINGSSIMTPSSVNPQQQTNNGCSHVEPQPIGGRIIYCQKRGGTVCDMGYSYESDNYVGDDLTLLSKDLTKNKTIVDIAYKQEPDSMIYFVRNDGVIICLTYVKNQKVYAWSHLETQGNFESIVSVPNSNEDNLYCVVKRNINGTTKRYIEMFTEQYNASEIHDFIMLDSAKTYFFNAGTSEVNGLEHLANTSVDVLADGRALRDLVVDENGVLKLPSSYRNITVGLRYESVIELPNVEVQLQNGTMQGRKKKISEAILRLENSLGGRIGGVVECCDSIIYDEFMNTDSPTLYTGDKRIRLPNIPNGGFMTEGRVIITHDDPYPFNLSAIVRVVAFGG